MLRARLRRPERPRMTEMQVARRRRREATAITRTFSGSGGRIHARSLAKESRRHNFVDRILRPE
jgi:hypothetical protein